VAAQYLPPPQQYGQDGLPIPQDEDMLQDHFEEFYEDIFEELTNIGGDLEQLRVCENLSDHLTGNVYAKFREEEDAEKALKALMVRPHSRTRGGGPAGRTGGRGRGALSQPPPLTARRPLVLPAGADAQVRLGQGLPQIAGFAPDRADGARWA